MEREAEDEDQRERRRAGCGRLADSESLGEVVQAQADGRPEGDLAGSQGDRRTAGANPLGQVRHGEQSERDAAAKHSRVEAELGGGAAPVSGRIQCDGYGSHCLREHVVYEEEDNSAGRRGEGHLPPSGEAPQTPDGQPEEDRPAGESRQDHGLSKAHRSLC